MALQAASQSPRSYELHNPYALPEATAPQLAARRAGVSPTLEVLQHAYLRLSAGADVVVVEGAGGWMAPLADAIEQSQLARTLQLPVVLVVGVRLGCLSHARLSERAILGDGLRLLGWVGNVVDPEFADASEYRGLLGQALEAPCLGWLSHGRTPSAHAQSLQGLVSAVRLSAGSTAEPGDYTG